MLRRCLWTTSLPWIVLSQTYYMNFIFNNNGYMSRERVQMTSDRRNHSKWVDIDDEILEISSIDHAHMEKISVESWASKESLESHQSASNTDEVAQVFVIKPNKKKTKMPTIRTTKEAHAETTTTVYNLDAKEEPPEVVTEGKVPKEKTTKKHTTKNQTTKKHTTEKPTTQGNQKELDVVGKVDIPENNVKRQVEKGTEKAQEVTTEPIPESVLINIIEASDERAGKNETATEMPGEPKETTTAPKQPIETTTTTADETTDITDGASKEITKWKTVTPHPPEFFQYPGAKCHEEMDLHELFGISLERDRGLPSKVFCEFNNSWGGPWHLMTRIELPTRVHMRHWFFGYITEDYKDMNINFMALAHIMNSMRIAMLIIGQDNNDQLVYNLYDDVVISGFNDLFMLRKAQLVAANTTDLLFVSVGDVITTFSGRNRSCPFHVIGGWWGFNSWRPTSQYFCVFPVDRDVKRPGYMAIFIKPSPFAINNTAMYENLVTTRRPWAPTVDARLMEIAKEQKIRYRKVKDEEFTRNKVAVLAELGRRADIYKDFEKDRIIENGQPLGNV
ncbi:uncharacterized protein LOC117581681 [Drosophila guanche]|uniref:Uncharacterized protein n=1 Tax=Drosophila guanche TaxID=7266 RepID=A0A3B0JVE6_DROGU|nr:uncharacterized protein LOC117581681 [Drosophila guanche]SPP79460.1 Hypothetical predicted protein [Drosophila guanche]